MKTIKSTKQKMSEAQVLRAKSNEIFHDPFNLIVIVMAMIALTFTAINFIQTEIRSVRTEIQILESELRTEIRSLRDLILQLLENENRPESSE